MKVYVLEKLWWGSIAKGYVQKRTFSHFAKFYIVIFCSLFLFNVLQWGADLIRFFSCSYLYIMISSFQDISKISLLINLFLVILMIIDKIIGFLWYFVKIDSSEIFKIYQFAKVCLQNLLTRSFHESWVSQNEKPLWIFPFAKASVQESFCN